MKESLPNAILLVALLIACVAGASAALPVTGVPVEKLKWVDQAMVNHMTSNGITGGVIGIMRNGVVIFQRGYGWKDQDRTIAMPENALVRLASCTKPITAAAIRKLEAAGLLALNSNVFDLGQTPPGIINIAPFPDPDEFDERLADITVQHCLSHRAGWDRNIEDDYAQRPCETAEDMGIESPPGVSNIIAWALGKLDKSGKSLHFDPDDHYEYSNFGYCVLGKIVETLGGMDVLAYHRKHVLTPDMWVPRTDLLLGETFAADQPLREAWYDGNGSQGTCVFARGPRPACDTDNKVDKPYGSWDHAAYVGSGGIVASAATMLELAERYFLQGGDPDIGTPLPARADGAHGGTITGTSTLVVQRTDGVNVFLFFNNVDGRDDYHFANDFYKDELKTNLTAQTDWPATRVGGFWVDPDRTTLGEYGSYDCPFADLDEALDYLTDGSRVNFKAGSSDWKGTITTRLQLRAPFGPVTIGKATP